MKNWLKENRRKMNEELTDITVRKNFSPSAYALHQCLTGVIKQYAGGKLIDIGCGDMPYKYLLKPRVTEYDTLDIERRAEGVKFMGSILDMHMIASEVYDTALCIEVLEHVPNPFLAAKEVNRILRKGGFFILSAPHLSRLHEEPHDYFRYTPYGIKAILETNGFQIKYLEQTAGFFSFIGHQFSTAVNCLFWRVPVLKWVVFYLNMLFCVWPCYLLDRLLKMRVMPLGFVCVAEKK